MEMFQKRSSISRYWFRNKNDTDNSLINNQLIKIVTEIVSDGIFNKVDILDLSSNNNYTQTYTVHDGYILNQETQKIIIIVNFALYISLNINLTMLK